MKELKNWTVWVGGAEVKDYLMTYEEAITIYEEYEALGYTDIKMEKILCEN